jgi:HlyD family secretion protein
MTVGRWIFALLIASTVGVVSWKGLAPKPPPSADVTTSTAKKGSITRTVTAAGHLQAVLTVKVSSNISGDLLSLEVKEGDRVKKGQVLGQIDKRIYEAQEFQLRAAVAAAKATAQQSEVNIVSLQNDLTRAQKLVAQQLVSPAELEKADTALKVEKERLAAAKQQIAQNVGQLQQASYNASRATLTAPMEGTILELNHKVGERIRGSDFSEDVVLLMGGLSDMEVKAEVGEHEVVAIHEGDTSTIDIDAMPDRQFKGRVTAVGKNAQIKNPGTDAEVTTFFVRVAMLDAPEGALPGMSSAVSISTATHENVVTVPIQAVTSREPKQKGGEKGQALEGSLRAAGAEAKPKEATTLAATGKPKPVKVVFVIKDGKAEMREVTTGLASRTDIEILSGINQGETIVDGPYRTLARELQDGAAVKVQAPQGKGAPGASGPQGGGRS